MLRFTTALALTLASVEAQNCSKKSAIKSTGDCGAGIWRIDDSNTKDCKCVCNATDENCGDGQMADTANGNCGCKAEPEPETPGTGGGTDTTGGQTGPDEPDTPADPTPDEPDMEATQHKSIPKWHYDQYGDDWEDDCKGTKQQSPINIITAEVKEGKNESVWPYDMKNYDYKEHKYADEKLPDGVEDDYYYCEDDPADGQAVMSTCKTSKKLKLYAKGRSLKVSFPANYPNGFFRVGLPEPFQFGYSAGSFMPLQFHFHAPSEHQIDGKHWPLEMHMVNLDDFGNITVVGVMFKVGEKNEFFESLKLGEASIEGAYIDPVMWKDFVEGAFPEEVDFYNYNGSLTTPPCSEKVNWVLLKKEMELSQAQLDDYFKGVGLSNPGGVNGLDNYRKVQPLHGREVYLVSQVKQLAATLAAGATALALATAF